MGELTEVSNGTVIKFDELDAEFTKIRTEKDRYGTVIGIRVMDKDSDEFVITEDKGKLKIRPDGPVTCKLTPVGDFETRGESDWIVWEPGNVHASA